MAAKTGIEPVSIPPWQGGIIPLDNMAVLIGIASGNWTRIAGVKVLFPNH